MACVKSFLAALLVVAPGALLAEPGVWPQADSARDQIFDAMEKARWLSFEGIVVRKSSSRDRGYMQVKVCQRGGVSKTTALSPLPVQGVTTVDDGKSWMTFIPDENRIIVQDSPRKGMSGRVRRAADQNYRFISAGMINIAGRKAYEITAQPRSPEMPTRKYWLDSEYPLTLRMEVLTEGKSSLLMDTKAISFISVSDDSLRLQPASDVRKIYLDAPERFRSAADAKTIVGFRPAMPESLPFGFMVHEPQIVGSSKDRFVALRLSDGLATATVYQWKSNEPNPVPCSDKASVREANGVRMRLVGDLPEAVLTRLLEAFVREALKGLMPLLGTQTDLKALQSLQFAGEDADGNHWIVSFAL